METILEKAEARMQKSVARLGEEYKTIRAGRANPAVLDKILVDYYGAMTPIQQMASISVSEARILVISPWDATTLKQIERAILQSNLGVHPTNDGKVIRIAFPQLTEDRRKELAKEIHKMKEASKVVVRNIRRDAMEKVKSLKKEGVSEDEIREGEKELQDLVNHFCKEIDNVAADKEAEIMEI